MSDEVEFFELSLQQLLLIKYLLIFSIVLFIILYDLFGIRGPTLEGTKSVLCFYSVLSTGNWKHSLFIFDCFTIYS